MVGRKGMKGGGREPPGRLMGHRAGHDVDVHQVQYLGAVVIGHRGQLLEPPDALSLKLEERLLGGKADVIATLPLGSRTGRS